MRTLGTVFALFLLGSLMGCTGTSALTAVDAAPKTAQPTQTAGTHHNYQLYGTPDKGEFMVDSATGQVWEFQKGSFVKVSVQSGAGQSKSDCGEMVYNQKTGKLENPQGCS